MVGALIRDVCTWLYTVYLSTQRLHKFYQYSKTTNDPSLILRSWSTSVSQASRLMACLCSCNCILILHRPFLSVVVGKSVYFVTKFPLPSHIFIFLVMEDNAVSQQKLSQEISIIRAMTPCALAKLLALFQYFTLWCILVQFLLTMLLFTSLTILYRLLWKCNFCVNYRSL